VYFHSDNRSLQGQTECRPPDDAGKSANVIIFVCCMAFLGKLLNSLRMEGSPDFQNCGNCEDAFIK